MPPEDTDVHVVVKDDNVWNIAKARLSEEATDRDIAIAVGVIADANDLDENGRDRDLIYPGEKLVIPDLGRLARDEANPPPPQPVAREEVPAEPAPVPRPAGEDMYNNYGDNAAPAGSDQGQPPAGSDQGQPPATAATRSIPSLVREQAAVENGVIDYPADHPIVQMYDKVQPSVVRIEATRAGEMPNTIDLSNGSGFFVGSDGLIATNVHVFDKFDKIQVITADGQKYDATIAGEDRKNDLALLKITPKQGQQFPALEIEPNSNALRMQQPVLIFGHPNGWGKTYMAEGAIDGATEIHKVDATRDPPEEDPNKKVIAVSARGEEGGSGGPAVGENGKVVGIQEVANIPNSPRGDHVFLTQVTPLNELIKKYLAGTQGAR